MKLTQKDFREFKSECKDWIDFFGLQSWSVYYEFSDENADLRAWCCVGEINNRIATIGLTQTLAYDLEPNEVRTCAFHEVCELLFMPVRKFLHEQGANEIKTDEHIHCLINTLENTVFKKMKGKSKCTKK